MRKTTATVKKRKIELSNLKKVLFPDDGIVKAELIEYYLKVAPAILRHVKGRPLSLVRYPDGITGETFFQKNRPDWAPDWLEHVALGDERKKIDYILATEDASLVWLANLACIELHQMHCRAPRFRKPDYLVFDLDPPEDFGFANVVQLALDLREHLERLGYHPFAKTSGAKGVHVVVPIETGPDFAKGFEAARDAAQPFVRSHGSTTTLHIKKGARKGKLLVDIYRNRPTQTIVSPYSVRGRDGAPVSMPLNWDELAGLEDPRDFGMQAALEHLIEHGDAWEGMDAYAVPIHTERKAAPRPRKATRKRPKIETDSETLTDYDRKRSFARTPEPEGVPEPGTGTAFVLHRHHASRLHYDLRLEEDGVLKSFAVPRGLPPRPGIKRMAVNTEDHPMKYLTFEGTIPKGEYGAGPMWIFATGTYEVTKKRRKDSFYFRLRSPQVSAEYRLIHTRDRDWLLERVDPVSTDWLLDRVEPMLAESRTEPPASMDYLHEVKWDGIRAMVALDEGELRIRSRSQRDITRHFPELVEASDAFRAGSGLFDAEIVCLDDDGRPVFQDVIRRIQHSGESAIARGASRHPAVCYLFDCLYLDGRPLVNDPLELRREWMEDAVKTGSTFRVSEAMDDGYELFEAAAAMGLEGIVAKERGSRYYPGTRSAQWLKIKARHTIECAIVGYTEGKGDRSSWFGALQLACYDGEMLRYVGKVGAGFNTRLLTSISAQLKKRKPAKKRPVDRKPTDDADTVWLEPAVVCEVQYASWTKTRTLREPVFLRMRPDHAVEDCRLDT
jgi:DNA ligase D-like protein (predicted ligase)/DNA ligase D-like protein (predicted polymerase)/DNA ligase D-like protein (predicted 3'-phosphoesterase)